MSNKPLPETHRVEYKRELTPELDLEKEVIAFLNTPEGGFIYTDPVEAPVEALVEAPVPLTETERKILAAVASQPLGRSALLSVLGYGQPTRNYKAAMAILLQARLIDPTLPDKPNSRLQQYRLTDKGRALLK